MWSDQATEPTNRSIAQRIGTSVAGVLGLEPRLTGPEPVGLPITPYPIARAAGRERTRRLSTREDFTVERYGAQTFLSHWPYDR
jgi:hypothetical protein